MRIGKLRVITLVALTLTRLLPLVLLTLPASVQSQFIFATNSGALTITGYTGPGGVVVIPNMTNGMPVTSIGNSAFHQKADVTGITIPTSVTNIGSIAFRKCISLTIVTIPTSVTSIGWGAFSFCSGLTNITIPTSVTTIRYQMFSFCTNLTTVTVPNGVIRIEGLAFYSCTSLTSGMIPNSVTNIGDLAFDSCSSLTSATIPTNVTKIGDFAFSGTSLSSITIPSTTTKIGGYAFNSCSSLTSVSIPATVTNIGEFAFADCSSLSAIIVDALNPFYSSVGGVLFNKSQTTLIQYPGGKAGGYTVPNGVTNIGSSAFSGCTSLTSISIPSSITNIGEFAFADCPSLSAITVDALNPFYSSVGGVLFNKSQTTLIQYPGGKAGGYTVPNSVTNIGDLAFDSCPSLTSATIPNSVTNIGDFAFSDCASLTGAYFQGNAPRAGPRVFYNDNNTTVYYLPGTTGWGSTFGGRPALLLTQPLITGQPQSVTVALGGTATFDVTVFPPALSYQWRKGGSPIIGATNTFLTLTNAILSDAGNYSVVVSNALGVATSSNAVLAVTGPPVIRVDGQLAVGGVNRTLSATVTIESAFTNGIVYYTLDGSAPNFSSPIYSGPININDTTIVRALALDVDTFNTAEAPVVTVNIFYPLSTTTAGGGSVGVIPPQTVHLSHSIATVSAVPTNGWLFLRWEGDASGTNNPLSLTMNAPKSVTAIFGTTVGTQVIGSGLIELNASNPIPYGTVVRATAIPNNGSYFVQWGSALTGTNSPAEFAVVSTNQVRAVFGTLQAGQAALWLRIVGAGSVGVAPRQQVYTVGDSVTLTATPLGTTNQFNGWSGDAVSAANPLVLTLNTSKAVTANFSVAFALGIAQQGSNIALSWPVAYSNSTLLSSPVLTGGAWLTNSSPQTISGSDIIVTLPATNSRMFYRLGLGQ